jgi:hypothetical protein
MVAERTPADRPYRVSDPAAYGKIVYGRRDVRDQVTGDWPPVPYIDQGESGAYLKSLGLKGPNDASTGESLSYPLLEREEYAKDYSTDDALRGEDRGDPGRRRAKAAHPSAREGLRPAGRH